jgi:hypothetical protein
MPPRPYNWVFSVCTFTFNGALETAVEDSRMFSPQNGVLETELSALALQQNEDEILSIGLYKNEKNQIGHAFISKFEAF